MSRVLAFRIEYDGATFHGYQRQKYAIDTVQGLIEDILSPMLGEPVEAVCAGRTDAGVHAIGQVVHVRTDSGRPLETVTRALWRRAHGRLAVRDAWIAPDWFHARHNASRRIYQYHLLCAAQPSPLLASRTWHVPHALSAARMREAVVPLLGRHDFKAYQGGGDLDHYFRTLYRCDVHETSAVPTDGVSYLQQSAPLLCFEVEADAFLPHMVRMLIGTLVDVGGGRRPVHAASAVMRSRDSRLASSAAPPQGLCLVDVLYPAICGVPQRRP